MSFWPWYTHFSLAKFSSSNLLLDVCQPLCSQLFKNWIPAHRSFKQQLLKINSSCLNTCHSARNLAWLYRWWIPFFHRTNRCLMQILLFSHPPAALYSSIPWLQNCQYYHHLCYSFETWLLQLTLLQTSQLVTKTSSTHSVISCTCRCQSR